MEKELLKQYLASYRVAVARLEDLRRRRIQLAKPIDPLYTPAP